MANEPQEDLQQRAEEERRQGAEQTVDDTLAVRDRINEEQERLTSGVKPTPTQRECDLMKLGVAIDEKEPSGAEPEGDFQRRTMEARLPGNSPYETRALGSGGGNAEPPKRGPGRPRKEEPPPPL